MEQDKWIKISKMFMLTGIIICLLALIAGGFDIPRFFDNHGHQEWYRIGVKID